MHDERVGVHDDPRAQDERIVPHCDEDRDAACGGQVETLIHRAQAYPADPQRVVLSVDAGEVKSAETVSPCTWRGVSVPRPGHEHDHLDIWQGLATDVVVYSADHRVRRYDGRERRADAG